MVVGQKKYHEKYYLEFRPLTTIFTIFLGQLFTGSWFHLGQFRAFVGPWRPAEVAVGQNKYHEKFSPEFRQMTAILPIFFGQLFLRILVSLGPISGLCRPVAGAELAVGQNNYHEKFSTEFRQLTAIFPIFFGQLFLRILVSLGPISGLCRPVAVARVVVGQQKYRENFLSDFRLLKTIFLIFFQNNFFSEIMGTTIS